MTEPMIGLSPDGAGIAVVVPPRTDGPGRIWVLRTTDFEPAVCVDTPKQVPTRPTWCSDSQDLVYTDAEAEMCYLVRRGLGAPLALGHGRHGCLIDATED